MTTSDVHPGIEHVVVLMLENRSYDHLLGFLDGAPAFRVEDFGNPLQDGGSTIVHFAEPTGEQLAQADPPHSHLAIMETLAVDALGTARMTGFVSAAARKLRGGEPRPHVHWVRISGALGAVGALGCGAALLAGVSWRLVLPVAGVAAAVTAAGLLWLRGRVNRFPPGPGPQAAVTVMQCMAPDRIPVLADLARGFTRCTRWHASVPGETWPNRNFVHSGTSRGTVDIELGLYPDRTIFEALEEAGASWRIYYDSGIPHVAVFEHLWDREDRLANWWLLRGDGSQEEPGFAEHVRRGDLPAYAFLEPRHQQPGSNSQHPNNNRAAAADDGSADFTRAEQLVADVYEALRANPDLFAKTVLVLTYDEHGGFFDHVAPPETVAPSRHAPRPTRTMRLVSWFLERDPHSFDFTRLGLRVPALLISPWADAGAVDDTLYDHTSVARTLRSLFAPSSAPLSEREEQAHSFLPTLRRRDRPRPPEDLPDLSDRTTPRPPGSVTRAAVPEQSSAPDEFALELRALTRQVDARLPEEPGTTTPRALREDDPRLDMDPDGAVVRRFSAAAGRTRSRG